MSMAGVSFTSQQILKMILGPCTCVTTLCELRCSCFQVSPSCLPAAVSSPRVTTSQPRCFLSGRTCQPWSNQTLVRSKFPFQTRPITPRPSPLADFDMLEFYSLIPGHRCVFLFPKPSADFSIPTGADICRRLSHRVLTTWKACHAKSF